jgi:hypothetical protein
VATEHVASIRGGHPWIFGLKEEPYVEYQNPYFLPWEDAVAQWTVRKEDYHSAQQESPNKKAKRHHTQQESPDKKAKRHYTQPDYPEPESPDKKATRHTAGHAKPHHG